MVRAATDDFGTSLINWRALRSSADLNISTVLAPQICIPAICTCKVAYPPIEVVDSSISVLSARCKTRLN